MDRNIHETQIFLTEENLVNNFGKVFGYECPFFGKILYLYMAKGYDKKKITYLRFLECISPFYDMDNRMQFNKFAFKILDIDRDNNLNIINLLHLQKKISMKTKMGQEIFSLLNSVIKNNLQKKGNTRSVRVDYDLFSKIVG